MMISELLLFRAISPKGFSAVRLIAALLFWGFVLVLTIAFITELIAPQAEHDKHGHNPSLQRRAH